jgi:hypothetical protein
MLRSLIVAAMILGFGLAEISTASAALRCEGVIHGRSEGATPFAIRSRSDAKKFARENWVGTCVSHNPLQWCDIALIKNPKMECKRVPNGLGGYNHSCVFRGQPCGHQ